MSVLPLPSLSQKDDHGAGLLRRMLDNPLDFGPPLTKGAYSVTGGTREVLMGPKSPPRSQHLPLVDGGAQSSHSTPSSSHVPHTLKGPISGPTSTPSPSRKGKETASTTTTPRNGYTEKVLHPHINDLAWPQPIAHIKRVANGLLNPSMACYANATLQVLLHTPPVLAAALHHDEDTCVRRKKGFCMLCVLGILARQHWKDTIEKAYMPTPVFKHLGDIKKGFSRNRQEDTHEFFRFVTDALQASALAGFPKDLPEKPKHTSWVYRTWGGEVRSRVVCSRCQRPSDTFDNFLDLSLDVNKGGKPRLLSMLRGYIREDRLEGDNKYHCGNCKSKSVATKSFKITTVPPILTFHFKRFSVNFNSWNGRARADKFTQFIEYPEMLDFAPYMVDPKVGDTKYRLFGVTCHRGTELKFGHYTSYVKSPDGRWYHADDEDMTPTSLSSVLQERSAYLLSYIRIGDDEFQSDALTPNGTPISNGHSRTPLSNGPATPITNGTGHGSPVKRKWTDDMAENTPDRPFNRTTMTTPVARLPNGGSAINTPHLPPLSSNDESTSSPSHANGDYNGQSPSSKFTWKPKSPKHAVDSTHFYGQKNDSSGYGTSRSEAHDSGGKRKRHKREARGRGPPMPFNQGKWTTGRGSKAPGLIGRMKPK